MAVDRSTETAAVGVMYACMYGGVEQASRRRVVPLSQSTETVVVGVLESMLAILRQAAVVDCSTETAAVGVLESSWRV